MIYQTSCSLERVGSHFICLFEIKEIHIYFTPILMDQAFLETWNEEYCHVFLFDRFFIFTFQQLFHDRESEPQHLLVTHAYILRDCYK